MSAPETIRVGLGARSYDVIVGEHLIAHAGALIAPLLKRGVSFIVTDENVAAQRLGPLQDALAAGGVKADALVLPAGESTKSFANLERVIRAMLAARIERGDLVIALGGGVIGDLVGLAAGLVRRGTGFVQIPTTLLAQGDSSVGGKTAINAPEGKNLVGLFHQPRLVLADIGALATLPPREMRAGYAEIVKYGLIGDAPFFDWLDGEGSKLLVGDTAALTRAVAASVRAKAGVVERDEHETGERALLNLGHTFGHALEAATGFSSRLLHGEGVAIGMACAFRFSVPPASFSITWPWTRRSRAASSPSSSPAASATPSSQKTSKPPLSPVSLKLRPKTEKAQMIAGPLALAAAALFAGAAVYINFAEHPARMRLPVAAALTQWKPSYKRGFIMQSALAIAGFLLGMAAWWQSGDWRWIAGAVLMIANWPFTLLVIMPVNHVLTATDPAAAGDETLRLMNRWNALHAVRTALGFAALAIFLWASL